MKNTLLIAAALMMAMPAFASKARVSALQAPAHLVDVQVAFEKPHQFNEVGELVTFEWGSVAGAERGQGGFVRKHNDAVWGLYLGRQSADFNDAVTAADAATAAGTFLAEENPFNVIYGSKFGALTWGATFKYSNASDKTGGPGADKKSNSMGVSFGITDGTWDASAVIGLAGKSETAGIPVVGTGSIENKGNLKVQAGWKMDSMYFYGSMKNSKVELNSSVPAVGNVGLVDKQNITLGVVNSTKVEGADFFYGVAYSMDTNKEKLPPATAATKTETTQLPVIIGVEAEAASWMTLRASLTQNVFLGETKDTPPAPGASTKRSTADNTKVAVGAGLKFGKLTLDGVLSSDNGILLEEDHTAANQGLMSEASLTYTF